MAQALDTSDIDGFRIWKGQTAVSDGSGTIYFISHTGVYRIDANTGEVETLVEDFVVGRCIGLHDDFVYYVHGATLCRIKTDGSEKLEYPRRSEEGFVETIYIHGDILYAPGYGKDGTYRQYSCDISQDPDILVFSEGANGFDSDAFADSQKHFVEAVSAKATDLGMTVPIKFLEESNDFLYFYSESNDSESSDFGRIDLETEEIRLLPISPYQPERVTVVDGWIFYSDEDGTVWRTTEDLSSTEKLKQGEGIEVSLDLFADSIQK
jgi:hypothetical protein